MTIYCIDDGGDGSQTNSTQSASTLDWSKADTSIANLISYDAAALTTSGNIIYFGHDHAGSQSGAWTLRFVRKSSFAKFRPLGPVLFPEP